jgi:hypothetical protein
VFARPWESQDDDTVSEAVEAQARQPWEPEIPRVKPEIVKAHHNRTMSSGEGRSIDRIKAQAFAKEYLVDFDGARALIRCGLADETTNMATLVSTASKFMRNPVVLQTLQAHISRIESDKIISRERILMGLLQEACYHGPGGSASARVAAWGRLAKILGMELPPEDPAQKAARGGVMLVPYMGGIEAWEASAIEQQAKLKADVRA